MEKREEEASAVVSPYGGHTSIAGMKIRTRLASDCVIEAEREEEEEEEEEVTMGEYDWRVSPLMDPNGEGVSPFCVFSWSPFNSD